MMMNFYLQLACILITFQTVFGFEIENAPLVEEESIVEDGRRDSSEEKVAFGGKQSPIDLKNCVKKSYPDLKMTGYDVKRKGFSLINTGTIAQILYPGSQPTLSGGPLSGEYTFRQVHFHWDPSDSGSEHLENGKKFATEMHFVHYKTEYGIYEQAIKHPDGLAAIALWFEISKQHNSDIDDIIRHLSEVKNSTTETEINSKAMEWMRHFMAEQEYYTYPGSLTTGLFSEVVTWIVLKKKSFISRGQLHQFRKIMNRDGYRIYSNKRALQPIGSRTIYCSNKTSTITSSTSKSSSEYSESS